MQRFVWTSSGQIPYLSALDWPEIEHGFYGVSAELTNKNFDTALCQISKARGVGKVFVLEQVHGTELIDLSEERALLEFVNAKSSPSAERPRADGFLLKRNSAKINFGFAVKSADCVPVIIKSSQYLALIHAGWRGLAAGILQQAIARMGGPTQALIGPAAGSCCYEVGAEVISALGSNSVHMASKQSGKFMLSTSQTAAKILSSSSCHSFESSICTICNEDFFSLRRSGQVVGKNIAAVFI